jgi:hypothetical protein
MQESLLPMRTSIAVVSEYKQATAAGTGTGTRTAVVVVASSGVVAAGGETQVTTGGESGGNQDTGGGGSSSRLVFFSWSEWRSLSLSLSFLPLPSFYLMGGFAEGVCKLTKLTHIVPVHVQASPPLPLLSLQS